MSGFFSANVTPAGDPNILWRAQAAGDAQYTNQLMNQWRQQELNTADMEHVSRLSAALLNITDPAERAQAYARGVGVLQSYGKAMRAPPTMPDEQTLKMLAMQGVPSADLYNMSQAGDAAKDFGARWRTGAAPSGGVATTPSATIEPAAFNNATAVREGLIKRGMDPDTATGAAANALHESVANPRTGRGDNGNAAGIFMWTGPRLQAYIDKTGHPPDGAPLDEQLDFLMSEWNGSESAAAAKIAAAQGPAAKAAAFSQYFLRPKDTTGEMQRRSATALQLQQQIGGGGTPGRVQVASVTPTTATDGTTAPPGSTAAPDAPWDMPGAPAPDQPTVPATTAAALPVATPAQPAATQPTIPPPPRIVANDMTAEQLAEIPVLQRQVQLGQIKAADADKILLGYQTANKAAQRQYALDVQAQQEKAKADAIAAENLRLSQESGQRDAERLKLASAADQRAADDAAQKAKLANKPVQGTDVAAQHESYLYEHANEIRDGTASEEVQRQYAGSYYALQQAGAQATTMSGPGNVGTIPALITRRLPPSLPEPPGGALPLVMKSPDALKQEQMTVEQGKAATYAGRMTVSSPIMDDLDEKALTWGQRAKEKAGDFIGYNLNSPDYKNLRVAQEAFLSGVIRKDSGAAVNPDEWTRYAHVYFPMPGDDTRTVALKRHLREIEFESMKREAGPNYKPPETKPDKNDGTSGKPKKPLSAFD